MYWGVPLLLVEVFMDRAGSVEQAVDVSVAELCAVASQPFSDDCYRSPWAISGPR